MGKKQRERKQRKEEQKRHGFSPPAWPAGEVSPQARSIMDRLGRGELFKSELELYEIVTNSAMLSDEPEFDGFEFDSARVLSVVTPLLAVREGELEDARRNSPEEYEIIYDEVRIEAINELLTRDLQRDFLRRYDQMLNRILQGDDADKITTALVTRSVFDQKSFPWGLAGIVVEFFEQARAAPYAAAETAHELVMNAIKKQHPEMTEEELLELLDDPAHVQELIAEIIPTPEQLQQLQGMADDILADFVGNLYHGVVPLDLYTDSELETVAERINAITSGTVSEGGEPDAEHLEAVGRLLKEFIRENMTPERRATLETDLTRIVDEWKQTDSPLALVLEMEQATLGQMEPVENSFLYAALVGQLRRAGDMLDEDQLENAEGEPDSSVIDGTVLDSRT